MGAFQRVWQGINIRGCLFHLCQAIFRKCGTLGLTNLLREHNGFMRCIKETCCLAMHPPDQIIPVWNRVVKTKLLAKFLGLKTLRVEFVPLSSMCRNSGSRLWALVVFLALMTEWQPPTLWNLIMGK